MSEGNLRVLIKNLEYFPGNSNRPILNLLDAVKHPIVLLLASGKIADVQSLAIPKVEKSKILSARSDLVTLEYVLMVFDSVRPGFSQVLKSHLYKKISQGDLNYLEDFFRLGLSDIQKRNLVTADHLVLLCEKGGIKNLEELFDKDSNLPLLEVFSGK